MRDASAVLLTAALLYLSLPNRFLLSLDMGNLRSDVVSTQRRDRQADQDDAGDVIAARVVLLG